ncbi:hypothetical protein P3517_11130 [Vibrio parahaemolyticus]|nr:hypothetical protein [Vibrio parahaemolyticus]MDF4684619.1 hypothetical protein [Vibrio parahaemolyticus]
MNAEVMTQEMFNCILITVEYFAILFMGVFIARERGVFKNKK